MPFEVSEFINGMADKIVNLPLMDTIMKNPIYTAFLIVFVIILIIMFVFRDADTEESLFVMSLRSGFYLFIFLVGVLYIHNRILFKDNQQTVKKTGMGDVFGGKDNVTLLEDVVVPININTSFD